MSHSIRIFWLVVLGVFLSGCSDAYRQVSAIRSGPDDPHHNLAEELDEGDDVRLKLSDGSTVAGTVSWISPHIIAVESGQFPTYEQEIPVEQITVIEKLEANAPGSGVVWISLGLIVIAVVVVAKITATSQPDILGASSK